MFWRLSNYLIELKADNPNIKIPEAASASKTALGMRRITSDSYTHIDTKTRSHKHALAHIGTRAHGHTYTQTHTDTRTHTDTHIHRNTSTRT